MLTFANALTMLRLCLIPVVIVTIDARQFHFAFLAFTLAGITDALDGYVARRFNQKSEVGAYLDALADKLLIAASFITLLHVQLMPLWLVVLVIFRDLMIMGAVAIAWLMQNPIPIEPLKISKANTAAQIIAVAYTLAEQGYAFSLPGITPLMVMVLATLTILSVTAYFVTWFRHMAE